MLETKRTLRKNTYRKVDQWDELTQEEFLTVFFQINSPCLEKFPRWELTEWLYNHPATRHFLVERLKAGKRIFHGPGKGFRDLVMGQFMFADLYYHRYHNEKDPADLDKLMAALFTDKYCQGVKRYEQRYIDERADVLRNLPEHVKGAIIFNYGAVRKWITQQFTHIFPRKQPDEVPTKFPLPRWDRHMWKLADGASDEDFQKIADSKMLNIMQKIDELAEESEKRKDR